MTLASVQSGDGMAGSLRRSKFPILMAAYALAYFVAAKVGIATSLPPEGIVVLWPPNALVLVTLLNVRVARWPILLLVTVATEVSADLPDYPLLAAMGYGAVNFFEAAFAALLLRRWVGVPPRLATLGDFASFILIGPVLASGIAALFGAAIYKMGAPEVDYLHYWRVFWFGDAVGLLTLGTPLLGLMNAGRLGATSWLRAAEFAAVGFGLVVVAGWALSSEADMPRLYLIFPFLLWSALRFGLAGASAAVLVTVAAAIGSALNGVGPFATLSNVDQVLGLQGLIAVVAVSTFMIALGIEESRSKTALLQKQVARQIATEESLKRAYERLAESNAALDEKVAERTRALEQSLRRNELLLKELQHRVKNNLQVVSSLVGLYGGSLADAESRSRFTQVQRQVGAIAAVYDLMHRLQAGDGVDLADLIPNLCEGIARAAGPQLNLCSEARGPLPVSADAAIAVSLAINELVTNCLKHSKRAGPVSVCVSCHRDTDELLIRISDDGPGFPPGFDINQAKGFGTRLVRNVLRQSNGRVRTAASDSGAVVELRLSAGQPLARQIPQD